MNVWLQCWSGYVRLTQRWPALAAIVPFIPVVALWTIVTEAEVFPRVFLPGPLDVVRSFATLTYKGILPDYLQDSLIRLFTGAALGMALGIPLGILIGTSRWAHRICWPVLLFFQAIGDIAWLPILLIWFGFGLTTMTFVIVYTVLFPVVLNTVLGVESVPRSGAGGAQSGSVAGARALGSDASRRASQYHHRAAQRARLWLARAHCRRDHRRHQRYRIHDVRCASRRFHH
jgi:NitT/TauT family transport system permease protein/taurine transport system permease protein